MLLMSGCATALVRSKDAVEHRHVYPATVLDAKFFWDAGLKGEPLFVSADPKARNGPVKRVAYGVGAIVDAPFSVAFDTLLLPVDLMRRNDD